MSLLKLPQDWSILIKKPDINKGAGNDIWPAGIVLDCIKGALGEKTTYPVDGPEGPQQTLLKYVLALRDDPKKMREFRCQVVREIHDRYFSGKY